ncbi:hypothetical protein [Microcoleus sp. B9-D4]|uniref:hypothetical protein n=1 Tax=Microcoleus sp. B9-D4 TaxID=2818711 RepID=UPI002FD4D514
MAKNQKTNRDHAKKTTKPMVEDEAIASQLSALLTPAITSRSVECLFDRILKIDIRIL